MTRHKDKSHSILWFFLLVFFLNWIWSDSSSSDESREIDYDDGDEVDDGSYC